MISYIFHFCYQNSASDEINPVFFNNVFVCSARSAVSIALYDVQPTQCVARSSKNTSAGQRSAVKSATGFLSETEIESTVKIKRTTKGFGGLQKQTKKIFFFFLY